MHTTHVTTLDTMAGGGYAHMRTATFTAKAITQNKDGTINEVHLPVHRQASIFRKDMTPMALAQGNEDCLSCWLQFQCGTSQATDGQWGYKVSEVIEALGHHDAFYRTCYERGQQVEIYKADTRNGKTEKDVRKKGPHYGYHMQPLDLNSVVPFNWYMIAEMAPIKTYAVYSVERWRRSTT